MANIEWTEAPNDQSIRASIGECHALIFMPRFTRPEHQWCVELVIGKRYQPGFIGATLEGVATTPDEAKRMAQQAAETIMRHRDELLGNKEAR